MLKPAVLPLSLWATVCSLLLPRYYAIYVPDDADPPAYCTVFGHIMKSGGSTIKWALDSAQPAQERQPGLCVFRVYAQDQCRTLAATSAVIEGYGELARRALVDVGRDNCSFFTMMRHPIDRLVSQFFYCPTDHDVQGRPPEWCGDDGDVESLGPRLVDFASKSWGNHAWRMMMFGVSCPPQPAASCGDEPQTSFKLNTAVDWAKFEEAKEILSTYTAVGILEHWDLSMKLFDARVTSPVKRWADLTFHVNEGHQSAGRNEILEWAFNSQEIHDIVQADLLLYEHALWAFRSQTAETLGTVWEDL